MLSLTLSFRLVLPKDAERSSRDSSEMLLPSSITADLRIFWGGLLNSLCTVYGYNAVCIDAFNRFHQLVCRVKTQLSGHKFTLISHHFAVYSIYFRNAFQYLFHVSIKTAIHRIFFRSPLPNPVFRRFVPYPKYPGAPPAHDRADHDRPTAAALVCPLPPPPAPVLGETA